MFVVYALIAVCILILIVAVLLFNSKEDAKSKSRTKRLRRDIQLTQRELALKSRFELDPSSTITISFSPEVSSTDSSYMILTILETR